MERIFLDYKKTVWERVEIYDPSEEMIEKAKLLISQGMCASDIIGELELEDSDFEFLLDTAEEISLQDNGYNSTIELLDDKRNQICNNGDIKHTPPVKQ